MRFSSLAIAVFLSLLFGQLANAQGRPDVVWSQGGHPNSGVYSGALSPDGNFAATSDEIGTVKIWRVGTREHVRTHNLRGGLSQGDRIQTVAFSPDSKRVAAINNRGHTGAGLKVWSVSDGAEVYSVNLLENYEHFDLEYSPDGSFLAYTSTEGVTLLNADTGQLVRKIGSIGTGNRLSFSSDSTKFVVSEQNGHTTRVVRVSDGAILREFNNRGTDVAFRPGRDEIAIAYPTFSTFNATTGALIRTYSGPVGLICYSPTGSLVASATGPVVSVYQSDSGTRIRHQEDSALTNGINSVLFSGDSSQIALFGRRPFAGFWPLEQQAFSLVEFAPIKEAVGTVAISPDSERIAYTHVRAEGNLWHAVVQVANLEDGTDVQTFPIFSQVHSGDVPRLIYGSSFGEPSHIYLSCSDGQVRKLNLETGVVSTLATLSGAVGAGISVTPDKNLVAVLAGGKVHVLRTSDGSSVQVIAPENTIESFSFSGNSAIAVGGGVLRVLEVPTGSELQRSIVIGTQVMSATQDGRFIATADRLRTYVFRRSDQGLVFTDGAYRTPGALAFLGGDKFLASFGRDATLRITKSSNGSQVLMYDQETGLEERPPHDTRPRGMTSGVVSPDGRYMAYGRVDGALVVARSPFSEFDLRVTRSTPSRVARLSQVFLNLEGGGFVEGAQVFLKQESQQLQASQVTVVDVTRLRAKFDLSAAALGAYEIVVRTPEAKEARLPNGLEVIAGAGEGQIAAVIEGPRLVRPDRDYVTEIEYTNTGSGSMPAPLLFISSGMKMRLSRQDGYSERPLVAMAIGESNQAGMLQPGATFRIPLYFRSVSGQAEITVSPIDSINASHYLNGWGQVRAQVYPFSLQNPPPQYEQIWVKFIEQFGNDSATHMQALRESAAYLALYGNRTPDVRKLMVNAMSAATGDLTPVSSLGDMTDLADVTRAGVISLGRTMPTGLGKYRTGPFGRGWWHTLEVHLEEEGNDIHIQSPGMRSRHFAKQPDGNYKGEPADHGKLEKPTTGGYRITELDGSVSIFDSTGHLMKLVDSNDNEVDLMYDGSGRLSEISADGRTLEITWTAFPNNQFRITKLTNSALQETSYVYDASGEFLLRVILPGGRHFRYDYYRGSGQSAGSLQKITSPDLSEQIFALDSLGRLSQISGTGGATPVQFALPGQGRVDTFDAASQRYTSQLGPEGQLMRSTNPVGDSVSMQYDDAQNLTELTSGRANRWSARYDAKGNPIWSKDPIGGELILSYTTDYNRLDKLKDRRGNTLDFDYDANGNTTRIRYPAAGSIPATEEVFTYYADGNVKSHTNRRGQKVDYAYTGRGQLAEVKYPDGRIFTYGYDNRGNLTSAADTVTGAIAMQYDARDFMIRIDHPGGKWFAYEYNNAGKRTKRTGDDGFVLNYAYDPQGRLLRITDGNNQPAVQYTYDIVGRLWKELKGNNTWTEYLYDAASRVRQIDHYSPQGALQARFTYTYDADGNPVTQGTPEGQWTYGYDALGQLTSAQGPGYSAMFQYDAEGNRVKKVENGVAANYTTNELNQYTQIGNDFLQYDLDGHLLAREGNRSVALQFDCVGNVSSISHAGQVSSYRYNALGQLFSSERNGVTSRHVYDGGSLAADYMVSGALRSRYVFGVGLVLKQSADSISYFGYDLSGHTRTATSVSGDIVRRNAYAPFSRVVEGASNDLGEYTFSGRNGVTSEAGGLYMMGARVFDSDAGRFLSPDPIGLAGGQSNLYSYVGNSPVVRSDPAGLCGTTDTIQLSFFSGIGGTVALHQTNDGFYLTVGVGLGAGASAEVSRTKGKVEHHATALAFQAGLGPINYSHELNSSGEMTRSGGVQVGLYTRSYEFKSDGTSKTKDALGVNAKLGAWWQGTRTHKLFDFKRHCPPSKDAGKDANDKLNENPNLRDPLAKHPMQDRTAVDPNEKNGPVGVGPERYLKTLAPIEYEILFENIGNAHVQELLVVDQLPAALDWSSLELGGIIWGNQTISEFAGLQSGTFRVPLSPPANPEQPYNPDNSHLVVDVTVTFDPADGKLTWRMKTIDPQTEEPPLGVAEGFLPPNSQLDANGQFIRDGNGKPIKHPDGRGEGKVILKIRPKVAPDGTKIVNKASITFDPGPNATTIITDPFASNVLDLRAPTSSVHQLPSVVQVQPFTVRWSGDDNGGSGISSFDVLVSTNGGAYQVWQNDTTETSATFTPTNGSTYRFYSVATDKVGHVESAPGSFDTQTLASTNSWVLAAASAPATVVGGDVVTGTVTLSREAPAEGVRVQLSSNSSALIVPSSTLVPIGGITGSFPISTQPVSTTVTRHLTTSLNGSSKQVAITLTPGGLLSFSVSPTNLTAGASTTGTLRLSGPARAGGTQVTITPNTSVITAPTSVTVPEGQSSTTFTLQTSYMSTRATRTVTATLGSVSKVASLTIAPAYDLVVNPSTVQSGQNTTARVTIPNAAPSGGVSIPVTASSSALVVPQSVTIPAGQFSALFTVGTRPVGTTVGRYVTVTYNGLNKSALVTITPYSNLATLAVNPSTVKGGTNTTGTVTLDLAAPSGGAVVNLSSSTSYIAVPASVTVPAGQTTVTFTITTRAVGSTFTRAISATRAGVTRTSNITLTP